jgi:hypothetical protein
MQRMELGIVMFLSQNRRTLNVRNLSYVHLITELYFLFALLMRVNMISPRHVVVAFEAWRYFYEREAWALLYMNVKHEHYFYMNVKHEHYFYMNVKHEHYFIRM